MHPGYAVNHLIQYAMSFLGTPYRWGGESFDGWDCSGLVQEILRSVGCDPAGDQTAHALFSYFRDNGFTMDMPRPGALVFYGSSTRITHVAFAIDGFRVIEAGGGDSTTRTRSDAAEQRAFVRMRPYNHRSDMVEILMPDYPSHLF